MSRIRQIRLSGFEVAHVIHRHGLEEKVALEVEAALIDAYPGMTNISGGHGNSRYGVMHAEEIVRRYKAETAVFEHKVIMIKVNRSALENDLYEATRYAWRLSKAKAKKADYILSVQMGLIVGAFVAMDWIEATSENFPRKEPFVDRWAFVGHEAPTKIKKLYVGKVIHDDYRKKGAANPIKYSY